MSFNVVFQMSFVFSSFPTVTAGVHAVYPQGELCYDIVCFTRLPYRHLGEVGDLLDGQTWARHRLLFIWHQSGPGEENKLNVNGNYSQLSMNG